MEQVPAERGHGQDADSADAARRTAAAMERVPAADLAADSDGALAVLWVLALAAAVLAWE